MNRSLKYWLSQLAQAGDELDREVARYAIVDLLIQVEIDWRLQHRLIVDGELCTNIDGWPSVSPCATLGNVGRSTAPGYTPFEKLIETLERTKRVERNASARLAEAMMQRLRPRQIAAVLLAGWQIEAPRRPMPADADVKCPRELTLEQICQLQHEIGQRLQLSQYKPFPSRKALKESALRAKQALINSIDDVCYNRCKKAA